MKLRACMHTIAHRRIDEKISHHCVNMRMHLHALAIDARNIACTRLVHR